MAKKEQDMDQNLDASLIPETKKSMINPKVFLIGLPVFIIQLVVVYFVTANILLSKMPAGKETVPAAETASAKTAAESKAPELPGKIFSIEDQIVNPAGTNGQRLLLTSIGLDVALGEEKEAELQKKFEEKKIIVQDIINTTLASKTVAQLNSITYRDSIKTEIMHSIKSHVSGLKINNIFFSKFIIQ